jgi:hypothetical protein
MKQTTVEGSLFQHEMIIFKFKIATCHAHICHDTYILCGKCVPTHVKMKQGALYGNSYAS